MLDDPGVGFPAFLERLVPRMQDYAVVLMGPGADSDGLLQSAVAVAASRHLLAAAAQADPVPGMPAAVAGVLGAWLDHAPGAPAQVSQAVHELFDELNAAAARTRTEGRSGVAAALATAAAELERAHGWLWLPPTLPAPAGPELSPR